MAGTLSKLEEAIARKREERELERLRILTISMDALKTVAPIFSISEAYGKVQIENDIEI